MQYLSVDEARDYLRKHAIDHALMSDAECVVLATEYVHEHMRLAVTAFAASINEAGKKTIAALEAMVKLSEALQDRGGSCPTPPQACPT